MGVQLTIITPVYNRAYCLHHCYESLKRQQNKKFLWMIIDDGSTDDLPSLVERWMEEKPGFLIEFYRKENGGKSTAYNLALEYIMTPYWTCIDSDDWVPDDVVEKYYRWIARTRDMDVAGFVGLDMDPKGNILGGFFPYEGICRLIDIKTKIRHEGDMNMVYRTDISKACAPMPTIPGEKYFEPYYYLLKIDKIAPLYLVNEVFCIADYQADGLTHNLWRTYFQSPVGMGYLRMMFLSFEQLPVLFVYRQCVHYVSSWILSRKDRRNRHLLRAPIWRPMMVAAWIPGTILAMMTAYMQRKG